MRTCSVYFRFVDVFWICFGYMLCLWHSQSFCMIVNTCWICLCIVPELESVTGIIAIMCLGNVFGGFSAGGFIVNHADIGPKHTGRLMGITNMVAALPGLVGGVLTGIILDATNSWDMVFYVVAGITFFGGIFYFLFASTEKQFD